MEKLIEILNKYEAKLEDMPLTRQRWRSYNGELVRRFMVNKDAERMIISKSFGFIKWLVYNDKIDKFYYENSVRVKRYIDKYEEYDYVFPMDYEQLIMLLSIEDNPIKWLCEILK